MQGIGGVEGGDSEGEGFGVADGGDDAAGHGQVGQAGAAAEVPVQPGRYWEVRKDREYYRKAVEMARRHAPDAASAIDVGPHETPFLDFIDWVPRKTAIDLRVLPKVRDATNLMGDFMEFEPGGAFDLVFCLQVLEHLVDPVPFAQKLLRVGRVAIISVPYKWPKGRCRFHPQDPVDEAKLQAWTGRAWLESIVVKEKGKARLIAVFRGGG